MDFNSHLRGSFVSLQDLKDIAAREEKMLQYQDVIELFNMMEIWGFQKKIMESRKVGSTILAEVLTLPEQRRQALQKMKFLVILLQAFQDRMAQIHDCECADLGDSLSDLFQNSSLTVGEIFPVLQLNLKVQKMQKILQRVIHCFIKKKQDGFASFNSKDLSQD